MVGLARAPRWFLAGLIGALLLGSCEMAPPPLADGPLPLDGGVLMAGVGGQRVVVAVFWPPASIVLLRVDGYYLWATPSLGVRNVYLTDRVAGHQVGSRVLDVNATGTTDYAYTFNWSG
ncbi:MAG TPA: hypothetical protein VKF59_11710 [Candidatus Dormibacteraeota bacterium]|nr:hypothetical protein [Candidatus Dormibacteraeota bacterium]